MRTALLLGTLALGLSACSVTVRPNLGLQGSGSNLITSLRPDRGEGSTYAVGESVRFVVSTRAAGYVTLIALQGSEASTIARNVYVPAGTTVFPRAQDNQVYTVGTPRGLQRVRAIFTRVRPTSDLVLRGTYDEGRWNATSTAYLQPYAVEDSDVQETYLYIR